MTAPRVGPDHPPVPLTSEGHASATEPGSVTLLRGSTFFVSNRRGDCRRQLAQGLFVRDTRILSDWAVLVDGQPVEALAVIAEGPSEATFVTRDAPPAGRADSTLVILRHRTVCEGMAERISVYNNSSADRSLRLAVRADADLANIFEVKGGHAQASGTRRIADRASSIRVMRGMHGVLITSDQPGEHTADGLRWSAVVPQRGQWTVTVRVMAIADGLPVPHQGPTFAAEALRELEPPAGLEAVESSDADLRAAVRRSIEDLRTLRLGDPGTPGRTVIAAGAPWYMALFGRDSILTSWMALPFAPDLAIDTLQTLADYQGRQEEASSEEEPGRIPHEVRFGPAAPLAFGARHAYYGTADATSLFVALVGEVRRWGHDGPEIRALLPAVDRALDWIQHYGDADGDGYVEYGARVGAGLANRGWKDSWDGINDADGSIVHPPIALAEVQGYTFAAYLARADLARDLGDESGERYWRAAAAHLKSAFNRDFWIPARGWFAVGLDHAKRPIDSLASNQGHCLWSGIADEDKAAEVAARLSSPEMFSGWGVRTLGDSMGAYNPVSYHNGSVWPHDTAICVAGMLRYGHVDAAFRIARGLLDAAKRFDHRLPELFCGFPRADLSDPVPYPSSCSPQAWAAAAPLLLLRSLLRLDPDVTTRRVWCAPRLPRAFLPLTVRHIRLGERTVTLTVDSDGLHIDGCDESLRVLTTPRPVGSGLERSMAEEDRRDASRVAG